MRKRIAVIGAGLAGIAAAGRLAAAGFEVTVFERQSFPGGKAGSETLHGARGDYRFDTGPSLLTMPFVFDDWFAALGQRREDSLTFIPLVPITSYFFADGSRLKSFSQRERFLEEIRRFNSTEVRRVGAYLDKSARIYHRAAELFLFNSLHEPSTYRSSTFFKALPGLPFIAGLSTMNGVNQKSFADPRLVQLFNRYATYNGSDPYRTPGTMTLIPHVEYNQGAYGVAGGIVAIPRAMHVTAETAGVRFEFNTTVDRLLTMGDRISGVQVGTKRYAFDAVVSNADVLTTYEKLLSAADDSAARRYRRLEPSSSGLVFYWGLKRSFPELGVHNIFFSTDYRREFRQIFTRGLIPEDPTVYINITSKITPGDAPAGGENWFILVNAPAARGQDWEESAALTRNRIIDTVSRRLGVDVAAEIEVEGRLTPPEIEARTSSTYGSLYGISSNSISSAFRRQANRCRSYSGLYFAGGSAHPGGGMPLALLSGKIAAELVVRYEENR